jgi:chloramphenicol-sensitive protein RarD
MNKGLLYAIGTYVMWGLLPVYWKALHSVPSMQIVAHRMVWSMLFMLIILACNQHWGWLKPLFHRPKIIASVFLAGSILTVNWLVYIWAVNAGYVVESSLGYFINPLVSVVLGVLFFRERLRRFQWVAVGIAAIGVIYLTIIYGALPWIALTLAFSFALYGVLKKRASLNSMEGLSLETGLMFLPALGYLLYQNAIGQGVFGHTDLTSTLLLIFTGVATAVPLLLFASAARRIPLSMLGILQYIAPIMQFSLGVFVYNEAFTVSRLVGFSFIWIALLIYSMESIIERRRNSVSASRVSADGANAYEQSRT